MKSALRFLAVLYVVARTGGAIVAETVRVSHDEPSESLPVGVTPVKGRLCFSEGRECSPTRGLRFEVSATQRVRRYVWTSEDHRTVFAGDLSAGAEVIDLASKETPLRTISLAVRGHVSRGWPADAELTIQESRQKEWKWELPAESTALDVRIHVPVANYVLFIDAPRHYRFGRRLPADKDLALGTIELKPLPSIRGRVVRLEDERVTPVTGAQILLGDGKVAGTTNEQGVFRIELSEPVAKEIVVASAGFGAQVMKLEQLEAENDLGEIRLESGVTLTLQIERPDDLRERVLRVRLLRHDEHFNSRVAGSELAAGEEEQRFPDLSPGQYFVMLEGDDLLERMLVPLEIGQEDLTKKVDIRPFRLKGRVLLGEEALRKGEVEIMPRKAGETWRARLKIEDDGSFGGILWQTGRLHAFIHGHAAGGILSGESPELGSDPSVWMLSFKNRLIHGRIFDAESDAAAEGVRFDLKTTGKDGGSHSSVSVAPNGEYEIRAWRDGTYDLIVSARDLLPETKTIELSDSDGSRQVDFALERGSNVKLEFFWSSGQRIVSPNAYEGVSRDGRNPERLHRTDAAGILTLSVRPGESRLIYVLPSEGSFAPVRFTATRSSDDQPVRVEIPPASGSLRVRLKDGEGRAAEGFIVMRYNGEWIPYPVTARLRNNTADGVVEFLAMPAGAYELWAITPPDLQAPPNMPPPHAPVRAGVAVGGTNVDVTVVRLP